MAVILQKDFPEAKKAILDYRLVKTLMVLEVLQEVSLMEIELVTGRHHQIRVQMANAGMPLLGDNKYGTETERQFSREIGCKNVALCAYKIKFRHPKTGNEISFERKPEEEIFLPFFTKGI